MTDSADTPQVELSEQGLSAAADAAEKAFAEAANLEELAVARREHLGDDAPIPACLLYTSPSPRD